MMRHTTHLGWPLSCALALACGLDASLSDTEASDDDTGAATSTAGDGATTSPPPTSDGNGGSESDGGSETPGGEDAYEDDDGGTGCNFTCPDPPPPPSTTGGSGGGFSECDFFEQDCPEGEKCMPWANDGGALWNAARCSPVYGNPNQPGEACLVEGSGVSGIDDCDLGVVCVGVDPKTNEGYCLAMCSGSEAAPLCDDPDHDCALINGFVPMCVDTCDPVVPDCPAGQGCYFDAEVFMCLPVPEPAVAVGQPCTGTVSCEPGALCDYGPAEDCGAQPGEGCCAEICDATDPGSCQGGQITCAPWLPSPAPPEYDHIGLCEPA